MGLYKDKTVLVTGASTGIGYALSKELSKRGAHLILVARSEDKLKSLAEEVKNDGVESHVLVKDLSKPNAAEELHRDVKSSGLNVDILINNAAYGRLGKFIDFDRADYAKMIQLNMVALTDLCHLFIPDMIAQGGGGIINVGSGASLVPVPYSSVYSASKAYVLMLSEAIRYEYRDQSVNIMALLPGRTESEFARVAAEKSEKITQNYKKLAEEGGTMASMQTSHEVALECLDGFEKNKQFIITGRTNRLILGMTQFLPRKRVLNMIGRMFKRMAAE